MLILVTGKSGSGKTTLLKATGLSNIYDADEFVKKTLYVKGHVVYYQICKLYPTAIKNDEVNREILGKILFSDSSKMNQMNNIVYPHVVNWLTNLESGSIVEMAAYINLEKLYKKYFHIVILIIRGENDLSKFKYYDVMKQPIHNIKIKYKYKIENDHDITNSATRLKKILLLI
ncbi:dephospho-CoA kinase [Candidatus Mycoplasma mahonii]|uniref:dephospho-CoA kinase n=1 Tax=Candidatus Mycoplasma mahonii TaxID=3004105 RepID=UPI0026ED691F|nr:dephospho-CoA kinase [Candidatus Mycoplasma mahonii]WKX02583.1 dephospho-CoA kinase [Candidatus Mycoplasma mahonii]